MALSSAPSYKRGKLIGEGGFASVYEAPGTGGKLVLKIEPVTQDAQIPHEYEIYRKLEGVQVVPKVLRFDTEPGDYVLVMENAGESLPTYITQARKILPPDLYPALIAYCASKMILALCEVHSNGIIHGDIHPKNFVLRQKLFDIDFFLVDFGAAIEAGKPAPLGDRIKINSEFASADRTISPSRGPSIADDLVALGYVLVYLYKGRLPWDSLAQSDQIDETYARKRICSAEFLTIGCPEALYDFLCFVLDLDYLDVPQEQLYINFSSAFMDLAGSICHDYELSNS